MSTATDWIDVADGQLRAVTRGTGPRRVFLPALGGSFELYRALVDALAERSRVTVIEPFGTAASDDPAGLPSTESLAESVVGAVDSLAIERFDLVGLSLGGMVAQWVAGMVPERVRSLALASTAGEGLRDALRGEVRKLAMARCLVEPSEEETTRCLADEILEGRASAPVEDHVEEAAQTQPISRRALLWLMAASARHDGREALARYGGRGRVLSGALDPIFPPDTQAKLLEHLSGARQVVLDGVGHDLGLEAPKRMARECDELSEAPGRQTDASSA